MSKPADKPTRSPGELWCGDVVRYREWTGIWREGVLTWYNPILAHVSVPGMGDRAVSLRDSPMELVTPAERPLEPIDPAAAYESGATAAAANRRIAQYQTGTTKPRKQVARTPPKTHACDGAGCDAQIPLRCDFCPACMTRRREARKTALQRAEQLARAARRLLNSRPLDSWKTLPRLRPCPECSASYVQYNGRQVRCPACQERNRMRTKNINTAKVRQVITR